MGTRWEESGHIKNVQKHLAAIGFPIGVDGLAGTQTRQAIETFQQGDALGPAMAADGIAGPITTARLQEAKEARGRCSANFWWTEFACHHCGRIRLRRELLVGLEAVRSTMGNAPVVVVSGYRCPIHNANVGGATNSRHLYGEAADLESRLGLQAQTARLLAKFTGLGIVSRSSGRVVHVDVGGLPRNSPRYGRGSTSAPTVWYYS